MKVLLPAHLQNGKPPPCQSKNLLQAGEGKPAGQGFKNYKAFAPYSMVTSGCPTVIVVACSGHALEKHEMAVR